MNLPALPKLICIVGPTASGKTGLSIRLAKQFNGYIISADSRQIYMGMDIGTAKMTAEERAQLPHFLIDITTPDQPLALNEIQTRIFEIIQTRHNTHPDQIPFLVGGTGLYINSVVDNWLLPTGKPSGQRTKWEQQPLDQLVGQLLKLEPEAAQMVQLKNKRRVIRAIEIAQANSKLAPILNKRGPAVFNTLMLGLKPETSVLDKRINQRVDQQIKDGLVEEVKGLAQHYTWDLPALSGIGYKEIGAYVQGKIDLPEAIDQIKLHTRQYARRQMTWFKRDKRIHWIKPDKASKLVQQFMK
ncbi:MAG: tRNA (adenosine(37)-N6)-dimethylallyltransferase MiaA [Patescibacteria group bacterium]